MLVSKGVVDVDVDEDVDVDVDVEVEVDETDDGVMDVVAVSPSLRDTDPISGGDDIGTSFCPCVFPLIHSGIHNVIHT